MSLSVVTFSVENIFEGGSVFSGGKSRERISSVNEDLMRFSALQRGLSFFIII